MQFFQLLHNNLTCCIIYLKIIIITIKNMLPKSISQTYKIHKPHKSLIPLHIYNPFTKIKFQVSLSPFQKLRQNQNKLTRPIIVISGDLEVLVLSHLLLALVQLCQRNLDYMLGRSRFQDQLVVAIIHHVAHVRVRNQRPVIHRPYG